MNSITPMGHSRQAFQMRPCPIFRGCRVFGTMIWSLPCNRRTQLHGSHEHRNFVAIDLLLNSLRKHSVNRHVALGQPAAFNQQEKRGIFRAAWQRLGGGCSNGV